MKLYPLFANIGNRPVTVIGGGNVAYRKIKDLLEAGARIKVISPKINNDIEELHKGTGSIEVIPREYRSGDIDGSFIVFTATDNPEINKSVFIEAEKKNILLNSADDPGNSSFIVPSVSRKGDLLLAVSTTGASPAMAAKLRKIFENSIPENIDEILSSLREAREILKNMEDLTHTDRGKILKKIIETEDLLKELVKCKKNGTLKEMLGMLIKLL